MKIRTLLLAPITVCVLAFAANACSDEAAIVSLNDATEWINSPPLTAGDLRGKVVLVDFWTYTCVNWMRTLPYLRAWSEKYRDQGLVIIGVHSPEFRFERNVEYVRLATKALHVDYPVAIDGDHMIWRAYRNQYWPAIYLIDQNGKIRLRHIGEDGYEKVEESVKLLLSEGSASPATGIAARPHASGAEVAADRKNLRSGENYLGRERTLNFSSPEGLGRGTPRSYTVPGNLALNHWALAGIWKITSEATVLDRAPGRIAYRFHARDVNLVMGATTPDRPVRFRIRIDGRPPGDGRGTDVDDQGNGVVREPRLYQLIRQSEPIVDRTFEIEFLDTPVATFSFTFG